MGDSIKLKYLLLLIAIIFIEKLILINMPVMSFLYLYLTSIFFLILSKKISIHEILLTAVIYDITINSLIGWTLLYLLLFYKLISLTTFFLDLKAILFKFIMFILYINFYNLLIFILTRLNIISISYLSFASYFFPQIKIQFLIFLLFTLIYSKEKL